MEIIKYGELTLYTVKYNNEIHILRIETASKIIVFTYCLLFFKSLQKELMENRTHQCDHYSAIISEDIITFKHLCFDTTIDVHVNEVSSCVLRFVNKQKPRTIFGDKLKAFIASGENNKDKNNV